LSRHQESRYTLRSTYEVKSASPSFEDFDSATNDDLGGILLDAPALSSDIRPLTEEEALSALEVFRDTIIAKEMENWERQRSILRDSMMNTHQAEGF